MQDKSVIEIGKIKGDKKGQPYQNFIEDMFPGKNYDVIEAVFQLSKEGETINCSFKGVDSNKGSKKNYLRYAYRKGSARGGDITFSTKFGDFEKKFKTFYPKQVKDIIAYAKKVEEEKEWKIFQALEQCIEQSQEEIKEKLIGLYDTLGKKEQLSSGFSVKFVGLAPYEYLENFKTVQQLLLEVGTVGKSEKYKVVSEGQDEICSICLEKKKTLHGFASPFKYATVDKTGLVSGFFQQKNNWKNYPICSDCALDFELGEKYVKQHLSKYFYGRSYYIIPKIIVGSNPALLERALKLLEPIDYQEKDKAQLTTRENLLMQRIAKEEGDFNRFALNLLFYEENQTTKAIKIKLFLEQIFPSRFQEIFMTIPKEINRSPLFKQAISINKEIKDIKFSFAILRVFFDDQFYEMIQTVFLGTPLSQEVVFEKMMHKIRKTYVSQGFEKVARYPNSYFTIYINAHSKGHVSLLKLAMMTIKYFKALNILPQNKTFKTMEINQDSDIKKTEQKTKFSIDQLKLFVAEHKDFFDLENGCKVGVFSVGVLVRQVFNLQAGNLEGNTPFEKKLKSYNLNPDTIKAIYLQAMEKLNRYTSIHSYKDLRAFTRQYFVLNSHEMNQISNNELSFYFVAGLEFGNQFKH